MPPVPSIDRCVRPTRPACSTKFHGRKTAADLHGTARGSGRSFAKVAASSCGNASTDERWAGLWDFPRFPIEADGPLFAREEIVAKVAAQTGITCEPGALLNTMKHGVTRYRITLDCYQADVRRADASTIGETHRFAGCPAVSSPNCRSVQPAEKSPDLRLAHC